MSSSLLKRIARGVMWRLAWREETLILSAGPLSGIDPAPAGFSVLRLAGPDRRDVERAESAMARAGEDAAIVSERLQHGDDFFGWVSADEVVSFGWVARANRITAGVRLARGGHRVFLYNFHTLPPFRGFGLYPGLLRRMRSELSIDGATEFIIDVSARNTASRRGIEKAGFTLVARASSVTVLRRWQVNVAKAVLNPQAGELFESGGTWQKRTILKSN